MTGGSAVVGDPFQARRDKEACRGRPKLQDAMPSAFGRGLNVLCRACGFYHPPREPERTRRKGGNAGGPA